MDKQGKPLKKKRPPMPPVVAIATPVKGAPKKKVPALKLSDFIGA